MIIKQLIVGNMEVCCYIIGCSKTNKGAVIDPGGHVQRILAAVDEMGLKIEKIIATHGHPDHVCGNRELKEATGADIVYHKIEDEFFNQPDVSSYFSMLGMEASPPADITVEENDIISVGEEKLKVILTPGHTPGGICLYNSPDIITGDTLFVGGIGRTDFPGGSYSELIQGVKEKLLILPEDTVVWPGHGYGGTRSTIGQEKRTNPYFS